VTTPNDFCSNCDVQARIVRERRVVPLGERQLTIDDERMRCDVCGVEFYTVEQADRCDRNTIEAARKQDGLLSPSGIRAIRESLQLTQRQFEQLLGVGEKTCVRWETGRVAQNVATDRLIRIVAAHPEVLPTLAALNAKSDERDGHERAKRPMFVL
jgi:putative zinc finger/helix-turn-helix YgiT family protein